jgi:hypothetical protein
MKRKSYSPELKAKVALEAMNGDKAESFGLQSKA